MNDPIDVSEIKKSFGSVSRQGAVLELCKNNQELNSHIEANREGLIEKPRHRIDIAKAIELRLRGVTYVDIANALGLPGKRNRNLIAAVCRKYIPADLDLAEIKAFESVRKLALAKKQKQILDTLTEEKLKKATVRDLSVLLDTTFNQQRLLQGESTANISTKFSGIVEEIHKRRRDGGA